MNLKETIHLLSWRREQLVLAIEQGVETPITKKKIRLAATKQANDFDIREEDVEAFIEAFENEEPGRYPPIYVRRELLVESGYQCAVCKSDSPLQYHHIIEWANLKHHDAKHMIAICGTCHSKINMGIIDTKAQKIIKEKMVSFNRRTSQGSNVLPPTIISADNQFSDVENRMTEASKVSLLKSMYIVKDEFVVVSKFNSSPSVWFHHEKFTQAFPGVREVSEFTNSVECVERLKILLKPPLKWVWRNSNDGGSAVSPLWWWRGYGNNSIDRFDVLAKDEVLLDEQELPLRRIIAVNSRNYWQSFVYVETIPKAPTGIYLRNADSDSRTLKQLGYVHEEYGLYNGHIINRAEYDDGAAIIDGRPQNTSGAKLRMRYLTPFNFLIASQETPINNPHFDQKLYDLMNNILIQKADIDELVTEVLKLPKQHISYD